MSYRTKNWLTLILVVFIVLTLAFIWGNSLLDREQSTEVSMGLLDKIEPYLALFGVEPEDDHILRKLAHFCEFGLLGLELALLVWLRCGMGLKPLALATAASLAVAVTDETLQYFTGRSCQLSDVLLDFSGAFCGIVGIWIISVIIKKSVS